MMKPNWIEEIISSPVFPFDLLESLQNWPVVGRELEAIRLKKEEKKRLSPSDVI